MMHDATREDSLAFKELGYRPIWVEDLEEGMHMALPNHNMFTTPEGVEFFKCTNLRCSVSYQHTEDGCVIEDSRHVIVSWFAEFDDGSIEKKSLGAGWQVWVKDSTSD